VFLEGHTQGQEAQIVKEATLPDCPGAHCCIVSLMLLEYL
jgi:hypothetical protein